MLLGVAKLQKEIKQKKPFRSRSQEAMLAILRTADVLKRRWRIAEDFGITAQQYNVLRILRGAQPEPPDDQADGDYRDQYQELTGTSLTECPACQRGRMVIVEVLKPAKPCRPIHDTS